MASGGRDETSSQMRIVAITAAMLASLALTGCAVSEGSTVTPNEVERDARDIFARTSAVVPAEKWTTERTWGPCENPRDGYVQLMFVAQSLVDVPEATPALAQMVVDVWRSAGRKPVVQSDDGTGGLIISDPAYLQGANADGSVTQLSLGKTAVLLQVISPCIEGGLADLGGTASTATTPPSSP